MGDLPNDLASQLNRRVVNPPKDPDEVARRLNAGAARHSAIARADVQEPPAEQSPQEAVEGDRWPQRPSFDVYDDSQGGTEAQPADRARSLEARVSRALPQAHEGSPPELHEEEAVDWKIEERIEEVRREIDVFLALHRDAESSISPGRVSRSDRYRQIAVTVDMFGNLMEIAIRPDLKIGAVEFSATISRLIHEVRLEADQVYRQNMEEQIPGWIDRPSLDEIITLPKTPINFHAIDQIGSWQEQNLIAEMMEAQYAIAKTIEQLRSVSVRQSIANDLGVVRCDAMCEVIEIEVTSRAMRETVLRTLPADLVDAIHLAEEMATEKRSIVLSEVAKLKLRDKSWVSSLADRG